MWKDNINNDFKYVWLAPNSRIKGEADIRKFETARKLKVMQALFSTIKLLFLIGTLYEKNVRITLVVSETHILKN